MGTHVEDLIELAIYGGLAIEERCCIIGTSDGIVLLVAHSVLSVASSLEDMTISTGIGMLSCTLMDGMLFTDDRNAFLYTVDSLNRDLWLPINFSTAGTSLYKSYRFELNL